MIQRIQSLYLLLAGTFLVLFAVFSDVWSEGLTANIGWLGPLALGVAALAAAVSYLSVALYKDRNRQRSVILVAQIVTLLTTAAAIGGLVSRDGDTATGAYLLALAPVVSYVLLRLAQRGVDADIEKVRSMDRLR
ncbi:MAG: DUF4293 family protein [Bacteroidota bacterium]